MPISELLFQGVELMLLGMGIVFTFLVVLVAVMSGMSRLAQSMEGAQPQPAGGAKTASATGDADETVVTVISAAIARYRAAHNK
jgi:oxaloacetate decarboxylase gamma subunit